MMTDGLYSSDSINSIYNHIKDIQLFEGEYFILPKDSRGAFEYGKRTSQ